MSLQQQYTDMFLQELMVTKVNKLLCNVNNSINAGGSSQRNTIWPQDNVCMYVRMYVCIYVSQTH